MKTCKRCGETKPLEDFHAHRDGIGGRRPECKACRKSDSRAYREANLARIQEYDRWRYDNQPGRAEANCAAARASYAANREAIAVYARTYYAEHPEVYERARQKRKALLRGVEHSPYSRTEIFERDGGQCRGCNAELENVPNGFHIDHIVPVTLGGPDIPANVQLMCGPCNRTKWATLEGQIHLPV